MGNSYPKWIIKQVILPSRDPILNLAWQREKRQKVRAIAFSRVGLHQGDSFFQGGAIVSQWQFHQFRNRRVGIVSLNAMINAKLQLPGIQLPVDGESRN